MKNTAQPLCSTCSYHEGQARRVNIMWGLGMFGGTVIIAVFGIAFALIDGNAKGIQQTQMAFAESINQTRQVVAKHERESNVMWNRIDHRLTVISMNQIRQMRNSGIRYVDPKSFGETDESSWSGNQATGGE